MVNGISGFHSYYSMYPYNVSSYHRVAARTMRVQRMGAEDGASAGGRMSRTAAAGTSRVGQAGAVTGTSRVGQAGAVTGTSRAGQAAPVAGTSQLGQTASVSGATPVLQTAAASARVPVQPVGAIGHEEAEAGQGIRQSVLNDSAEAQGAQARQLFSQGLMDPSELAVRMRIQYGDSAQEEATAQAEMAAAQSIEMPGRPDAAAAGKTDGAFGAEGVQEAAKEGECETCEKRKYQDGSDDMGVSFQTPTHIAPEAAASQVRGHEMEHVVREQAKAEREDREVVSQSVTLKTSVCPECGKVYVSGGNTRTVTAAKQEAEVPELEAGAGERRPFSAVA